MRLSPRGTDERPPADLSAFLDGELGFWRGRRVRAHLRDCPPCRRYVEQLEQARVLMASMTTADVGVELRSALQNTYAVWVQRPLDVEVEGRG